MKINFRRSVSLYDLTPGMVEALMILYRSRNGDFIRRGKEKGWVDTWGQRFQERHGGSIKGQRWSPSFHALVRRGYAEWTIYDMRGHSIFRITEKGIERALEIESERKKH